MREAGGGMIGWKYLGTIGPGGGQLAGEQGHNDYLIVHDLTNDAPRVQTLAPGDRVKHKHSEWAGTVRAFVEPRHVSVKADNGFFTMVWPVADFVKVEPEPPAPRRRTEPAITVPPERCPWYAVGFGQCVHASGHANACEYARREYSFTYTEVEACKAHGSAAYACMAADCDQVRELLAVEEAKAAMEVWRLSNGEWLDWHTDSDCAGVTAQDEVVGMEYERTIYASWLRSLTPPLIGETLGDWCARMPPKECGPVSREYMQHLYDKLAKGEVVGG